MSVSLEVSKREVRPRSLRNKLRHEGKSSCNRLWLQCRKHANFI